MLGQDSQFLDFQCYRTEIYIQKVLDDTGRKVHSEGKGGYFKTRKVFKYIVFTLVLIVKCTEKTLTGF